MRVAVVGAGIIGLAVAQRLQSVPGVTEVTVLEKGSTPAAHQTSHNSGVVHAGVYYAPGSLKATLCRRGMERLREYCAERGVAYQECGKVIVALDADELGRLDEIERRARANGVPGLRRLSAGELREIEPHVAGAAALHSPRTAITDFPGVARALAGDVECAGGRLSLGFEVTGVRRRGTEVQLLSQAGEDLVADYAVLCAGLQSDRLARLAGDVAGPAIVPFRGEYYRLLPDRGELVRGLIYPVPDPAYPFLGVHFTRRVDGGVDVGPNAILALAREGYRRGDVSLRDLRETLAWPGFRRLARRHWRTGVWELHGSLSRRAFIDRARAFIPELGPGDVEPAPAGIRAQAVDADGSLVDDFRISELDRVLAVRNAPSPAATSSLAIAEHVVDLLLGRGRMS
ncbi:MAG TPA: L-2-hydroxyglutarate oxidase [Solirubrobacteraceae bacterium]|nr:L-2-hydroxyglutarate oxidase [Solirubrobacteraceae bacterium]